MSTSETAPSASFSSLHTELIGTKHPNHDNMNYFLVHYTTSGWQILFVSDRLLIVFRKEKNRIMFLVQCFDILNVNKYH